MSCMLRSNFCSQPQAAPVPPRALFVLQPSTQRREVGFSDTVRAPRRVAYAFLFIFHAAASGVTAPQKRSTISRRIRVRGLFLSGRFSTFFLLSQDDRDTTARISPESPDTSMFLCEGNNKVVEESTHVTATTSRLFRRKEVEGGAETKRLALAIQVLGCEYLAGCMAA